MSANIELKHDEKLDEIIGGRRYTGAISKLVTGTIVVMALYHILYIARIFDRVGIIIYDAQHRAINIATILIVIFLFFPPTKTRGRDALPWYDILLVLLSLIAFGYGAVLYNKVYWEANSGIPSSTTVVMCFIGIFLLCEAGRRVIGLPMVILVIALVFYSHFANLFPGFFKATSFLPSMFAFIQYVTADGIFGIPVGVFSTVIIMFVIFAHFLRISGAGDFFLNLAFSLVGHIRGGPAKAAVVASGLFGTISGSASANVASTGVITIPLMKRLGLSPPFAGGVEAAASTGGLIMPPVMGAVAFIMAEWLRIPYIQVCVVAAVPAILYYIAVYLMVDGEAIRLKLSGLPRKELSSLKKTMREGWYHMLPLVFLVILLAVFDYRADYSALLSVLLIIGLSMFKKKARMGPQKITRALRDGIVGSIPAGISCALAGVILGSLTLTAVGVKLSSGILYIAGGNLFVVLLLAAIASLILGMGMPAVPIYIMLAILIAPALADMGVPLIAAHLFVYYCGVLSFITPPVATAAYTASAIANSNPIETAVYSMRIGIVAVIIPFVFAYNPGLILVGSAGEVGKAIIAGTIGVVSLVIGVAGYVLVRKIHWGQRIMLVLAGVLLFFNAFVVNLVGVAIFAGVMTPLIKRFMEEKDNSGV